MTFHRESERLRPRKSQTDNAGVRHEQVCDDFDKSGIIRLIDGGPLMPARRASERDDLRWVALKARRCFATLRAHEAAALDTRC